MAYDVERGVIVLHGGLFTDPEVSPLVVGAETWTLDEHGWKLTPGAGALLGLGSRLAYDASAQQVTMYAGNPAATWRWDGSSWVRVHSQYLWVHSYYAMAYDTRRGRMVLHGGVPGYPQPDFSPTWEWDGFNWVYLTDRGPVNNWYGTAMVYDQRRGVCVAYGDDEVTRRTFEWDGRAWTRLSIPGPEAVFHTAMAYDSLRGVTVLFGGEAHFPTSVRGETWEYDGVSWRMVANAGPAPRLGHAMAYDERRGVTVLFGGWDRTQLFGDTWEWNGKEWREFTPIVTCYADCDTSTLPGVLDIFDFLCFQNRFAAGGTYACDCDTATGPATCDIFDFLCFQNAFAAGCR